MREVDWATTATASEAHAKSVLASILSFVLFVIVIEKSNVLCEYQNKLCLERVTDSVRYEGMLRRLCNSCVKVTRNQREGGSDWSTVIATRLAQGVDQSKTSVIGVSFDLGSYDRISVP